MSTKTNLHRIPLLGIILIAVGVFLLADQTGMLNLTFWNVVSGIMVLYGAVLVIRSFANDDRSKVFWGTFLFLLGLFFILDGLGLITQQYPVFLPAVFLMLGFSFLMMYLYNLRDWHILIPTVFFAGCGLLIIADELSIVFAYRFSDYFFHFWPVLLILFGLGLIAKARRNRQRQKPEPVAENTPV